MRDSGQGSSEGRASCLPLTMTWISAQMKTAMQHLALNAQFAAQAWTVFQTRVAWKKFPFEHSMSNPKALSQHHQLWQALVQDQPAHVRKLLAQGNSTNTARFTHEVRFDGAIHDWPALTATALAVLVECDALEDDRRLKKTAWARFPCLRPATVDGATVQGLRWLVRHPRCGRQVPHAFRTRAGGGALAR